MFKANDYKRKVIIPEIFLYRENSFGIEQKLNFILGLSKNIEALVEEIEASIFRFTYKDNFPKMPSIHEIIIEFKNNLNAQSSDLMDLIKSLIEYKEKLSKFSVREGKCEE